MTTTHVDVLPVPGGELHHQVCGTGPILLISQAGEGDADRTDDLVRELATDFTVVTYDRRGLSRSAIHGAPQVSIAAHAEDVTRLISHLSDEPVAMLGCSMGAAIGLHIAAHEPARLSVLIAHEPVSPWLLPAAERARHHDELEECQRIFGEDGWRAALHPIARSLGIDPAHQEVESGVTRAPITADRGPNFTHFLRHDLSAIRHDRLEPDTLRRSPVRIVPAAGRATPRRVFDRRCAERLAELLGVPLVEFPGGHNGSLTHPSGWARAIRDIVTDAPARPCLSEPRSRAR